MFKDRKTTLIGIITIAIAVLNAAQQYLTGQPVDFKNLMAVILGYGLVKAADSK